MVIQRGPQWPKDEQSLACNLKLGPLVGLQAHNI